MAATVYEGMYIFDSSRYARDPAAVSSQVTEMIEKAGGEMLVSRLWEDRRLAYPIRGHRKGAYWLAYFRIDGPKLAAVIRQCEISDDILRHLFVKIDERLVDALVSHAMGLGEKPSAPDEDKDKDKDKDSGDASAETVDGQEEEEAVAAVAEGATVSEQSLSEEAVSEEAVSEKA